MGKLKIVLGDLSYDTPLMKGSRYVPLGVGYLASYVNKIYGGLVDIKIFKDASALLDYSASEKPDLIGFSHYYWNTELNRMVMRRLRREFGGKVKLVLGGPSIDSDPESLLRTCLNFPEVDYLVPNEGELGFANIVGALLSCASLQDALDGVAFAREGNLICGKDIGLSADLSTIDSPYLTGFMDPFMQAEYLPMLQTSRLCPYTCAFCVSGKNTGKLRSFPIDQVKAEIEYIAKKYQSMPSHMLYISDDNFGILARDVEIARHIRFVSERDGFPKKLFYYNDKKFGETSRDVHDLVGHMCFHGLMLSLQTENPETLKVIKRRNMSADQLNEAISWGRSKGMPISTELIFGLPMETRRSFLDLIDKCMEMQFDSIHCYNLIVFEGIELNRPASRQQYALKTKFRHVGGSYCHLGDDFCAEADELVVGAEGFDINDFRFVRALNVLLYCTSYLRMHTLFFAFLKELGVPFSTFIEKLFDTGNATKANKDWINFINELNVAIDAELFNTRDELINHLKRFSEQSGEELPESIKINPVFGCRLIQHSSSWVSDMLRLTLEKTLTEGDRKSTLDTAGFLLEVGARERVAEANLFYSAPIETKFDVVEWRREGYRKPLDSYRIPKGFIVFTPSPALVETRTSLSAKYDSERVQYELYESLRLFQLSATDLIYHMTIAVDHSEIRSTYSLSNNIQ